MICFLHVHEMYINLTKPFNMLSSSDRSLVGERRSMFFLVLLCVLVVAERKKMNVIGTQPTRVLTYCVQVVAGRKKIICILPSRGGGASLFQRKSNVHTCTLVFFLLGANFHHLMTQPKKYVYVIYILFEFYKGFVVEKMCQKLPDFEGIVSEIVI
jgi:hypothetical protein